MLRKQASGSPALVSKFSGGRRWLFDACGPYMPAYPLASTLCIVTARAHTIVRQERLPCIQGKRWSNRSGTFYPTFQRSRENCISCLFPKVPAVGQEGRVSVSPCRLRVLWCPLCSSFPLLPVPCPLVGLHPAGFFWGGLRNLPVIGAVRSACELSLRLSKSRSSCLGSASESCSLASDSKLKRRCRRLQTCCVYFG